MAYSMTGFGRHEFSNEDYRLTVELRSVNSKYLDLNIKLGHRITVFENKIRAILRENISRGKVDALFKLQVSPGIGEDIVYNKALASMYLESMNKIAEEYGIVNDITAPKLASMKDVLTLSETSVDEDGLWEIVSDCLFGAVKDFNEQRLAEGERMKEDLLSKLVRMEEIAREIDKRSPDIIEEYKEKLTKRVSELCSDTVTDPNRIAMEVTLFADKIAVDEEVVRLLSHVRSFRDTLCSKGDIGRKLDFIAQEMNRESNTILSKTQDAAISDMGIELKTLIEKMREQVQNLE